LYRISFVSYASSYKGNHVKSIVLTRIIYTFYDLLQTIIKLKFIVFEYKKILLSNKCHAELHNFYEYCFIKLCTQQMEVRSCQFSYFGWSWTIGFRFKAGTEIFVFFVGSDSGSAQPPIHWVLQAVYPRLKLLSRETDPSPSSSAVVKNFLCYRLTASPSFIFME
jgi:hypothetical protein